jgi:hypothetical protein
VSEAVRGGEDTGGGEVRRVASVGVGPGRGVEVGNNATSVGVGLGGRTIGWDVAVGWLLQPSRVMMVRAIIPLISVQWIVFIVSSP